MNRIILIISLFIAYTLGGAQPLLKSPALTALCENSDSIVHARIVSMGSETKENGVKTYDIHLSIKKVLKGRDISGEVIKMKFDAILPDDINQRTLYTTALERRRISQILFLSENTYTVKSEEGEIIERRSYDIIDGWFGAMPFSPEFEAQINLQLQELNKS